MPRGLKKKPFKVGALPKVEKGIAPMSTPIMKSKAFGMGAEKPNPVVPTQGKTPKLKIGKTQ